jgi:hypothetical protein
MEVKGCILSSRLPVHHLAAVAYYGFILKSHLSNEPRSFCQYAPICRSIDIVETCFLVLSAHLGAHPNSALICKQIQTATSEALSDRQQILTFQSQRNHIVFTAKFQYQMYA